MWPFSRRSSSKSPAAPFVGAFGKLPCTGDFLRVRAGVEPAQAFQQWLGKAIDWAAPRGLAGWPDRLDETPFAFVFSVGTGVLVGVLRGSRDAAGRRFPLAVFGSLDESEVDGHAALIPHAMASFLSAAHGVIDAGPSIDSPGALERLVDALPSPRMVSGASAAFTSWTSSHTAREVWQSAYGADGASGARVAVHTIIEALAPFAGTDDPTTPLCARVPLGADPTFEACAWLDLVRAAGGWRRHVPTAIWPLAAVPFGGGASGARPLVVGLGQAHPLALAEVVLGGVDADQVCDLTKASPPPEATRGFRPLGERLVAAFEDPASSIGVFLDAAHGR